MRLASSLGLIVLLTGWTGLVRADVQFGAPSPDVQRLLRNGTRVTLELDNGAKVTGHVVRVDVKNNEIFVRRRPGDAPAAYAGKDITKLTPAARPAISAAATKTERWHDLRNGLQENDQGVLRIKPKKTTKMAKTTQPGGQGGSSAPPVVVEPEIHRQVIYNGAEKNVIYTSSVLSPAERNRLEQIQKAENDVLALDYYARQRADALALEGAMAVERLRTQRLVNFTLWNENMVNYPYPPATPDAAGLLTLNAAKGVFVYLPQVVPPVTTLLDRMPPIDPQAVANARAQLSQLQSTAIYEDGRLTAVIVK